MFLVRVSAPTAVAADVADVIVRTGKATTVVRHRGVGVPSGSDVVVAETPDAAVDDVVDTLGQLEIAEQFELTVTYLPLSGRFTYVDGHAYLVRQSGERRRIDPYAATMALPRLDDITVRYALMMAAAAAIAAAGLVAGLEFAIVGAMAISPDLGRMNAIVFAIATRRPRMVLRAILSLAFGLTLAIAIALTLGALMASGDGDLLKEISPALLDFVTVVDPLTVLIALAAGVAAAVVFIAEHGRASAGVGVSITTIPAAGFAGVAAAAGDWAAAGSAVVVLAVNVTCVVAAGLVTDAILRTPSLRD